MKEMHQHREHMLDVAERIIEKRRALDEPTAEFTPIWAERRRLSNLKASVILVVGSFIVWFGGLGLIVWLLTR